MNLYFQRLAGLARGACVLVAAVLVFGAGSVARCDNASNDQWIVVAPPGCSSMLAPLIEHRRAEGFKVISLQTTEVMTPEQIQQGDSTALINRLRELAKANAGANYVLLVGNVNVTGFTNPTALVLPGSRGTTARMLGEPGDYAFGLPDAEGVPSICVGRFPSRTLNELRSMVRKTLAFEASTPGSWQDRLLLLVGNPGGGTLGEMFMQQNVARHLGEMHPAWRVRTIMNISSSPFYLPRPQDRGAALEYLREGTLFSAYLGHSNAEGMGLDGRFMLRRDWTDLDIPGGAGPFLTVGCWACQSNGKGDGYGLAAMRNPAGPVAVIGPSGESYSAPGQLAVEGLLSSLVQPPFPVRLGHCWRAVQTGLARGKIDPTTFALLDAADGTGGKVPLATQRIEHLEMWMLLGDPAVRLPVVPVDIAVQPVEPVACGKPVQVRGTLPPRLSGAVVRITLERPLNSQPAELERLPANVPENRTERERIFAANHQRANSFEIAAVEAAASGTNFVASLVVPTNVPWTKLTLRTAAAVGTERGIGTLTVPVKVAASNP